MCPDARVRAPTDSEYTWSIWVTSFNDFITGLAIYFQKWRRERPEAARAVGFDRREEKVLLTPEVNE